jgi:putative spermidine/putrescine transport system permease protein
MKFAKPMFAPHTSMIERVWYFTLRGLAVLTLLYLILPVLAIVPLSFSSSTFLVYPIPGWSLRWYQNLIASDEWRMAAKNSFIVAPSATVLATILGTLAAIGLTKANFKGKALLMAILISPMIVPVVVVGVGMYLFFAPLGLANTYIGLIMAHASLGVPFVVTTVAATLQGFNYNLVRASLSLGANPVKTFFSITLPVIARCSRSRRRSMKWSSRCFSRAPIRRRCRGRCSPASARTSARPLLRWRRFLSCFLPACCLRSNGCAEGMRRGRWRREPICLRYVIAATL